MGETISTLLEPDQMDGSSSSSSSSLIDLESGGYYELNEEEFYHLQYQRMVDRFGSEKIDARFFFSNCIFIERYVQQTGDTTQFCWMPKDHIIARLLVCNPHYHHGLLSDTLQECQMIGCITQDARDVVDFIITRFRDYGFMSPREEPPHDQEEPPPIARETDDDTPSSLVVALPNHSWPVSRPPPPPSSPPLDEKTTNEAESICKQDVLDV